LYVGEFATVTATYNVENASEVVATLNGDEAFTIKSQENGWVEIVFTPESAGTFNATLTITADGVVSESIDFSASAIIKTTAVDEVSTVCIYAKNGTIYCDEAFTIYNLAGVNVTHLNGDLQGVYIVRTNHANQQVSVW
jgi:hypothetical protein